jgi:hypothetical protein
MKTQIIVRDVTGEETRGILVDLETKKDVEDWEKYKNFIHNELFHIESFQINIRDGVINFKPDHIVSVTCREWE